MMSGNYTSIDSDSVSGSVPAVSDSPAQISVKFSDSDLQTFPDADDTFSKPLSGSWFRAFTVGAYKPYFDVDTSDVLDRIKDSVLPFSGVFNEKNSERPDLNGENDLVCIEPVAKGVRSLMESSDYGEEIREKVKKMSKVSKKAVMENGSSFVALAQLVDQLLADI